MYRVVNDAKSPIVPLINWSIQRDTVTNMKNNESWIAMDRVKTILYILLTDNDAPTRLKVCHPKN